MNPSFFSDSADVLKSLVDLELNMSRGRNRNKRRHSRGNSILIAGNGGSCSDGLHFAGELSCTYEKSDRLPYRAICLTANQSAVTVWANDFDFSSFLQTTG